jgi:hypothetical protein
MLPRIGPRRNRARPPELSRGVAVTEVMLNGPDDVYVERRGRIERVSVKLGVALVPQDPRMSPGYPFVASLTVAPSPARFPRSPVSW